MSLYSRRGIARLLDSNRPRRDSTRPRRDSTHRRPRTRPRTRPLALVHALTMPSPPRRIEPPRRSRPPRRKRARRPSRRGLAATRAILLRSSASSSFSFARQSVHPRSSAACTRERVRAAVRLRRRREIPDEFLRRPRATEPRRRLARRPRAARHHRRSRRARASRRRLGALGATQRGDKRRLYSRRRLFSRRRLVARRAFALDVTRVSRLRRLRLRLRDEFHGDASRLA